MLEGPQPIKWRTGSRADRCEAGRIKDEREKTRGGQKGRQPRSRVEKKVGEGFGRGGSEWRRVKRERL